MATLTVCTPEGAPPAIFNLPMRLPLVGNAAIWGGVGGHSRVGGRGEAGAGHLVVT